MRVFPICILSLELLSASHKFKCWQEVLDCYKVSNFVGLQLNLTSSAQKHVLPFTYAHLKLPLNFANFSSSVPLLPVPSSTAQLSQCDNVI